MGVQHSVFDLASHKIEDNLTGNVLADAIGYKNGVDAIDLIVLNTADNWKNRGKDCSKEKLMNLCTAGVSGQGKTELCRQVILQREKFIDNMDGVREMVAIPISFHQHSPFSSSELSTQPNVEWVLIWRILYAFGHTMDDCCKYKGDLRCLLADIRMANSKVNPNGDKVGIFLLVDEILKVRSVDEAFFNQLVDFVTGLQHQELRNELPTFVLITSLELTPVSEQIVTKSTRRILPIPLPFMLDTDLEMVAENLLEQFERVLCPLKHQESYMLKLVIQLATHISGCHFRCLEDALGLLYQKLVSEEQHNLAKAAGHNLSRIFRKRKGTAALSLKEMTDVDISIKSIFDSVLSNVDMGGVTIDEYRETARLLIQLLGRPDLQVCEESLYRLEANKLVFVKSRNVLRAAYIVPRVNLPFLYFYPRLHDEIFNPRLHDEIKYEAVPETRTINDAGYGSSLPYVRLKKPALLNQHIDVLLYNIGTALARPIKQLSRTFEDMVPFVELLTVAARHTTMSHISLEALIPDVVFKPWTNETLSVSPTVLRQPFHSTCVAAEEVAKKAAEAVATEAGATSSVGAAARRPDPPCASSPQVAVEVAVRYATSRDCDAVYVLQGTVKTQCIEYVSTLFSVRDKPVLSLCSMKLRETTDTVEVANRVHQLVRQTEGTSLEKGSYYVMLYCCAAKKSIEIENLPAGTIVVPYEAVIRLLYPFGLNPLSTVE